MDGKSAHVAHDCIYARSARLWAGFDTAFNVATEHTPTSKYSTTLQRRVIVRTPSYRINATRPYRLDIDDL